MTDAPMTVQEIGDFFAIMSMTVIGVDPIYQEVLELEIEQAGGLPKLRIATAEVFQTLLISDERRALFDQMMESLMNLEEMQGHVGEAAKAALRGLVARSSMALAHPDVETDPILWKPFSEFFWYIEGLYKEGRLKYFQNEKIDGEELLKGVFANTKQEE